MKGLLGRDSLPRDEGLLIPRCASIHTWFMRFPIDAVFLDRDMAVVRVATGLRPRRMACCLRARHVLELAAGGAADAGIHPGMRVRLEEA